MNMDTLLKQQLKDVGYIGDFSLESLIDACGEKLEKLENKRDKDKHWFAYSFKCITHGKTPLIAVAKLYIALNKK